MALPYGGWKVNVLKRISTRPILLLSICIVVSWALSFAYPRSSTLATAEATLSTLQVKVGYLSANDTSLAGVRDVLQSENGVVFRDMGHVVTVDSAVHLDAFLFDSELKNNLDLK